MFFLLLFFLITSTMVNPNMMKMMLPKANVKGPVIGKSVTVSIDQSLNFYLNKGKIDEANLQNTLAGVLKGVDDPTIIIQAEHTVPVENVVKVMAIGKKLNAKVLLATDNE
jgi:biopolymer transport protein ExbD